MKSYVIGWTHFDNEEIESAECGFADCQAIVEDIREHGYSFSGYAHQEFQGGAPVMNDGRIRRFSKRNWGSTMASAHKSPHPLDYTLWAEAFATEEAELKGMPSEDRWIKDIPPLIDRDELYETYRFTVDEPTLERARTVHKYTRDNSHELRFIDVGDTVVMTCGEVTARFAVTDIKRGWNFAREGEAPDLRDSFDMHWALRSEDEREKARAFEKYKEGKDVLCIVLKAKDE